MSGEKRYRSGSWTGVKRGRWYGSVRPNGRGLLAGKDKWAKGPEKTCSRGGHGKPTSITKYTRGKNWLKIGSGWRGKTHLVGRKRRRRHPRGGKFVSQPMRGRTSPLGEGTMAWGKRGGQKGKKSRRANQAKTSIFGKKGGKKRKV